MSSSRRQITIWKSLLNNTIRRCCWLTSSRGSKPKGTAYKHGIEASLNAQDDSKDDKDDVRVNEGGKRAWLIHLGGRKSYIRKSTLVSDKSISGRRNWPGASPWQLRYWYICHSWSTQINLVWIQLFSMRLDCQGNPRFPFDFVPPMPWKMHPDFQLPCSHWTNHV